MAKDPSAMQENWVRSLGWEDPLEKGMATRSSILASYQNLYPLYGSKMQFSGNIITSTNNFLKLLKYMRI